MSSYSSLLWYCLLYLMVLTIEISAEKSPAHGDDLIKRVDELNMAIKLATASIRENDAEIVDLHQKAKEGMAKQFMNFLQQLQHNYFSKLPSLNYYLHHRDCLNPEQTQNLIDTFHNGILHSGKSCIYKKTALNIIDQLQSLHQEVTVISKELLASEDKCLEKDDPEDILYCLSAILYKERKVVAWANSRIPIWKLALADYIKDDSTLSKTCYDQIPAQAKAKYEAILDKYCLPPPAPLKNQ